MRGIGLLLVVALLLAVLHVPRAQALSCAEPRHPAEEMGYSAMVFKGRLIAESDDKLKFDVFKVWKGSIGTQLVLYQNFWTEFVPGKEYIVFAGVEDGKLRPQLCGNTGIASEAVENQLGEPIPITPAASTTNILLFAAYGGAALFVAFLVYWMSKKRNKRF